MTTTTRKFNGSTVREISCGSHAAMVAAATAFLAERSSAKVTSVTAAHIQITVSSFGKLTISYFQV